MKTYTATFRLDDDGWWFASVQGVPGCHTQGRSLKQARTRIREALAACVGVELGRIIEDVQLPREARRLVKTVGVLRDRASAADEAARRALADGARALTNSYGLSRRDVGALMGLSHQGVQQIVAYRRAGMSVTPRRSASRGARRRASRGAHHRSG